MSKLTREDILKLAKLSRLTVTDDEVAKYQTEISAILDFVEQLDSVDMKGVEPTYQVTGLKNVTRPDDDEVDYQAKPDSLMKNAPTAIHEKQFKVRRVL